ncbi:MAG: hypothetical protein P1V36_18250 [Planctomycetota bacterium]|nr:hypothetical protein [Planctomycetota bacterium]
MSGAYPDVQLITGAGRYEVDLLVRKRSTDRCALSGQITAATEVHEYVCRLPLALLDATGRRLIAQTRTDELGEFALGDLPDAPYILRIGASRDAPLVAVEMGGDLHAVRTTGL